ncbi:MAG: hypothetical protein ACI810_000236, partial [Gammaproteobacteria bacterium]
TAAKLTLELKKSITFLNVRSSPFMLMPSIKK